MVSAEVSDGFGRLDVGIGYPDFVSRTVIETATRTEPNKLGFRRVEPKAVRGHPGLDMFDA